MRRTFQIAAAAAAFPVLALASQVEATVLVLPAPYSAFFIWNNDGTVSPLSNPTADYTGIQQQSELWDDFTPGSSLLAGTIMSLSFATVGGRDRHTISFLDNFGGPSGTTFTWSYDVSDAGSGATEGSMSAAILQTSGRSTLIKTIKSGSDTYIIDFTQTGGGSAVGTTTVPFLPGTTTLDVVDKLTIGLGGSDITGVSNSITENPAIPEASTWAMMLLGFAGLGFAGYRKSKAGRRTVYA